MDEEITIIDAKTRNEKIKNFFIKNKKKFIAVISIILFILIGYFSFNEIKKIKTLCRIDTKNELEYYKNGGILQYVLRNMI